MQSIGERLEEARKRKGVTIREAAEATKIRGEYLNSFENNSFNINVPDIYVRGFLRSYSNFLKINADKVITDFNATLIGEAKTAKRDHREFFGRMELQQPLVTEESKAVGQSPSTATIEESRPITSDESDKQPNALPSFLQNIDKEVAIKVGIIAAAALLLLLVIIWVVKAIASGGAEPTPAPSSQMVPASQTAPAVEKETIVLIALGDVRVTVTERDSGRVLLNLFPMVAGQREPVEKTGPVKIDYTAGENLQVEVGGVAYSTGKTGPSYSTIP